MPRRKSDGAGGRSEDAKQDSQLPIESASDEPASLPPAGAESAPSPAGETAVPAGRPFEGGVVAEGGAQAPEDVDTAAAALGGPVAAGATPGSDEGSPPDLSTPAETASPEAEAPLSPPEPEAWQADTPLATPDLEPAPEAPRATPGRDWEADTPLATPDLEPAPDAPRANPERDWEADTPLATRDLDAKPSPRVTAEQEAAAAAAAEPVGVAATAPPVPPAPPVVEAHEHRDDEDDGGTSVAAWALGILLLLLAGAALGTWAAPKIAPRLPAGMAPVAEWLEPGSAEAEAEIAALRGELEGVEAKVGAVPSANDLDARIGAAVSPVESRLGEEIGALRQALDQAGNAETRQQLETLSADLKNQAAQLETLKSDLTGAAGQVSGDVNVFKADMEGLRAEVGSLRDQVAAQAARLDEVAKSAEARVAAAEQQAADTEQKATTALDAAEASASQALIRAAVASGAPYADAVAGLEDRGVTVPPELAAGAQSGIPTLATLRSGFPDAAHAAIQASVVAAAGDGVLARANAFLKAQVASRSLTPREGPGTDAVLSRMEEKLRQDDLAGVVAESQALPSEAQAAMADWLASARLRLGATNGLAALAASLPATN